MAETAATVTIGRNIGVVPLSAQRWESFKYETLRAVTASGADDVWVDADYPGGWGDVREDAHVIHAGGDVDVDHLRQALALLARRYGQETIGLTTGVAELVAAVPAAVGA